MGSIKIFHILFCNSCRCIMLVILSLSKILVVSLLIFWQFQKALQVLAVVGFIMSAKI